MNKKISLSALFTGLVIVGTAIALAASVNITPAPKYPDLGGIAVPLNEGATTQPRNGQVDFSLSQNIYPFSFATSGSIAVPKGNTFKGNTFNITSGDFKIEEVGRGIIFPDGSKQTTAAGGMFKQGKLCQAVGAGWSNTTLVPDSWTASTCNQFAIDAGGTTYKLGCSLSNSFGASGGTMPANNDCGWSASCLGAGLYYPSNPLGCANPQKVLAPSNQVSVASGMTSVQYSPIKETVSPLCVVKYDIDLCTRFTCSSAQIAYASALPCGSQVRDDRISTDGTHCGTGNVYQVYCR